MQKPLSIGDATVGWPWLPSDVAPADEEARVRQIPLWQRVPLWIIGVWLVGVIVFISLGYIVDAQIYRHQLSTQASWIAQASHQEAVCLQKAKTARSRSACAATLAKAATAQQQQFDHSRVGAGGHDAAIQMHSAFDALAAAACYDLDSGKADVHCLAHTAPTLRAWAVQEATSAANW
jgi:hypothetical protein